MTKQFVMMAGPPCSGKTTFSKNLDGFVRISTDDYIEAMAEKLGKPYSEIFEDHISDAIEHMMASLYDAIDKGQNIVLDQTNLSRKTRMSKLREIPKDYSKSIIYLDIGYGSLLDRNQERFEKTGKLIPDKVLQRMAVQAEIPTEDEGWDNVNIVIQE
jgi:tRNA uridine 5-carbamoylmethylation protein Kti12